MNEYEAAVQASGDLSLFGAGVSPLKQSDELGHWSLSCGRFHTRTRASLRPAAFGSVCERVKSKRAAGSPKRSVFFLSHARRAIFQTQIVVVVRGKTRAARTPRLRRSETCRGATARENPTRAN